MIHHGQSAGAPMHTHTMRAPRSCQHRAQKAAFEADNAPRFLRQAPCRSRGLVFAYRRTVTLIVSQRRKREQLHGNVVRSLMRQKGAVVRPTILRRQRHDHTAILLKFRQLIRINNVAQVTGDHSHALSLALGALSPKQPKATYSVALTSVPPLGSPASGPTIA